jgi:hypothetical protein
MLLLERILASVHTPYGVLSSSAGTSSVKLVRKGNLQGQAGDHGADKGETA